MKKKLQIKKLSLLSGLFLYSVWTFAQALQNPLGYIDESALSCFRQFEFSGSFIAGKKFDTRDGSNMSNNGNMLRTFQVPLVGDLNGDGKPEIVALQEVGTGASYPSGASVFNQYLFVFDGQTGRVLVKKQLPINSYTSALGYHGTPCTLLLMNVGSDPKKRQIVVALGTDGSTTSNKWSKRLICYEVAVDTFTPSAGSGPNATSEHRSGDLNLKWVSDKRYDYSSTNQTGTTVPAGAWTFTTGTETRSHNYTGPTFTDTDRRCYDSYTYFSTPLPQLVDFDADGNPEIYVYNKIYDAKTGKLKLALEELGPANSLTAGNGGNYTTHTYSNYSSYAFVGRDRTANNDGGGGAGDTNVPFAFIYDLDRDGKYDIAAGGKVYYNITFPSDGAGGWNYNQSAASGYYSVKKDVQGTFGNQSYLGDGYTGVADINGDGIAEVVALTRTPGTAAANSGSPMIITAYNPGFFTTDAGGNVIADPVGTPSVVAKVSIPVSTSGTHYGNHSYLYIGDIDGLEQNGKRYPEISLLAGRMYGSNSDNVPLHPNVAGDLTGKLSTNGSNKYINYGGDGSLLSFTWDDTETDVNKKLKVSFVMLHRDNSDNTGFTLFDFDYDGLQDICYRDMASLRIVSARSPHYVGADDNKGNNPMIRYSTGAMAYTGFEYPVIADIDGDNTADMIVTSASSGTNFQGGILAIVGTSGDEFAPAPMVWNQFMYSPLKINADLTVPSTVHEPLSPQLRYTLKGPSGNLTETQIYNNTITQTKLFATFKELKQGGIPGNPADSILVARPILREPDAAVTAKLEVDVLTIKVKNLGTAAVSSQNVFAVYNGIAADAQTVDDGDHVYYAPLGTDIFPGDSLVITLTSANGIIASRDYIVRVSDANYATGSYLSGKWKNNLYLECNWADNWAYASDFVLNNDVFVVTPYEQITFDVLDNDVLPSSCSAMTFMIDPPAGTGWGTFSTGGPSGTEVTYKAPPTFPGGIVEIEYRVTCSTTTKTGKIYIYVLETTTNEFSKCIGTGITVTAKPQPAGMGTTFEWTDKSSGNPMPNAGPGTFTLLYDTTFIVRPLVPDTVAFPPYELKLKAVNGTGGAPALLRWKGAGGSGDWHDPYNWVIVESGVEGRAGLYVPGICTDVEIPGGVTTGYPTLKKAGLVKYVSLKDRAMLGNTHLLTYDSASVEVNFKATTERDRWVMYSAPLRKTYTGDFMLRNAAEVPMNGSAISDPAVYMSFFQTAYPDNPSIAAMANAFTQPFGTLDIPLPLGKSFNVWIDEDVDTGTPFRFPSPLSKYDYWAHYPSGGLGAPQSTGALDRTDGASNRINGRFIVEDVAAATDPATGQFTIPASALGDQSGYQYIMAPNPFMASLDMAAFLTANTANLENHYKVWNGADGTFISYQATPDYRPGLPYFGGTWWISSSPTPWDAPSGATRYVSPLQSFIVEKNGGPGYPVISGGLIYRPTTMLTTMQSAAYGLRNAKEENIPEGILYITASHNSAKNSTALVNAPEASNSYVSGEDVSKLNYDNDDDKAQLSVYTLTPERRALDINMSGNFSDAAIPFGIRTNISGEIQLDFSGVATFGYKVYLLDGDKEIDLHANPAYKATIAGNEGDLSRFYEINDRFALKFLRAGNSISKNSKPFVQVQGKTGKIHVIADEPLQRVEVYTSSGTSIYKATTTASSHSIDVAPSQVYIVRVVTGSRSAVQKVIVK
ncbi:T9SS type A sorting domain-containing protein [Viscerimonas tarda]